jgi:hypothetical protein
MNLRLWIDLVSYNIMAKGFGVTGAQLTRGWFGLQ